MITDDNIKSIYKLYNKHDVTLSVDSLKDIWGATAALYKVHITNNDIIIDSFEPSNPFHVISIERIYSVLALDRHILIVLPACIIVFNKQENKVSVHLRPIRQNIFSRLFNAIKK